METTFLPALQDDSVSITINVDLHYVEWPHRYFMLWIHDNLYNQFSIGGYPGGFQLVMSNFGHASLCTSIVISEESISGRQIAESKAMYYIRTFKGSRPGVPHPQAVGWYWSMAS